MAKDNFIKITSAQAKWVLDQYHIGKGISNKLLHKYIPGLFPGGK